MPPVGFEPTISADEWPKTYVSDRAATGTGDQIALYFNNYHSIGHFQIFKYNSKSGNTFFVGNLRNDA